MKKNFNKKPLIALFVIGLVVAIGGTVAYFTDTVNINNIFGSKVYGTTVTETFTPPVDWRPGDNTTKTIAVTNSGDVDVAVRIKLDDSWTKGNQALSKTIVTGHDAVEDEDIVENVAILHLNLGDGATEWTAYEDSTTHETWYYYNSSLHGATGASEGNNTISAANSLLQSVEFNSKATDGTVCTSNAPAANWDGSTNTQTGSGTITCTSAATAGYDNAQYELDITVETIQNDSAAAVWGHAPTTNAAHNKTGVTP